MTSIQLVAYNYKFVATDQLTHFQCNSRTHSDEQVVQIADSIREFGFTNPILIDGNNGIIAGHGRLLAAKKLGIKEVPTIELPYLSEAQKRAYVIADNKLALNAGWDEELLQVEFDKLSEEAFDLELTGFSLKEIENLSENEDKERDLSESFSIELKVLCECDTETEQEEIYNLLTKRGYKCKILSM